MLTAKLISYYHATGGKLEKQASYSGSKKLSNPVKDASEEGDVTAHECAEGDGWINMSAGDVGTYRDGNKESECVSQGGGNEASRCGGTIVREFVKCHAGAFAGEHENQG